MTASHLRCRNLLKLFYASRAAVLPEGSDYALRISPLEESPRLSPLGDTPRAFKYIDDTIERFSTHWLTKLFSGNNCPLREIRLCAMVQTFEGSCNGKIKFKSLFKPVGVIRFMGSIDERC
ncbi:hypothetical protein HS088_TW19G00749 [Tripterygium wilfordii]|uniref:Uncharacterized protein n=1 Tax=Tripterygium wilfordii TaxID=458696 RepID=A0A7J7CAE5_TRIWF|nr:uncharacterized protein LOC119986280 [Tripterygium wilfordii]XP_038686785.1 uncharacterized protein LOC119986280 [Tripterygium wilfordii]KAF5731144.1 hypothetical protein HS088_TW19G00749 [Tripterygium wilfordii]